MYAQHVGLDGSTVEMCNSTGTGCGLPGSTTHTRGRLGAYQAQYVVTTSSLEYVSANRNEMLYDEAERYRRGVEDEPRPACCPPPFDVDNNWMKDFPKAYVIPVGHRAAERRRGQAPRRLAAVQRHRGGHAAQQRVLQRSELRQGLVRRLDGPGAPRARRHGAATSASTSPTGSASSTRLPRRGATATCGAPTSPRSRTGPASRR